MRITSRKKRILRTYGGILLGGTALLGALAQSQYLLMPESLESVGHMLYRVAFFVVLPLRIVLRAFSADSGFHPTPIHLALISYGTSLGIWIAWRLFKLRHQRHARSLSNTVKPSNKSLTNKTTTGTSSETVSIPANPARRRFLQQSALSVTATIGIGGGAWGALIEPDRLRIRKYSLPISDLPDSLTGMRIVHLSDTHYGPYISLPYLRHVVERINELAPDLVVLTGDYVHQTPRAIPGGIGVFAALRPRLGTLAVLGNHDHWEGADACRRTFAETGVHLIDNGRVFVTAEKLTDTPVADSFCLGGVGDLWEDAMEPHQSVAGAPASMPRLVLSHNPDVAEQWPKELRVDLIFAGHTHGGQVSLPGIGAPIVPSAYGQKYEGGLCQGPVCRVLISRGAGMAVLPFRMGVPPEISLVRLVNG